MTPCFVLENKKNNLIEPSEKNIPEHKETNLFKVENYKCKHGCNYKFKTKKQMILHHDKIDSLCFNEKKLLINLIESYKNSLDKIISDKKLKNFEKTDEYICLQQQIKKTKKSCIDKMQLECLIENDDDPKNKDNSDNNDNNND